MSRFNYEENWIKADKDINEYPIGTRFKAITGGYWVRVKNGFKWCCGATFPRVGGDWDGYVLLPKEEDNGTE